MFKNLSNFDFEKPVNRKQISILFVKSKVGIGWVHTQVWLYNTLVFDKQNVNNIVTLNTGGWKTMSTKRVINRALQLTYGRTAPYISQRKDVWYVNFEDGSFVEFKDGMVLGGGSGIAIKVL